MSTTLVRKAQIRPLNISRSDINTTTTGSALITKIIVGSGLTLSSTGVDAGTGDATIGLSIASASVLGGVKIGSGLTVAVDGTISVTPVATTWGSITGTLSNQTDLQAALNAKYNNPTGTSSQYIDGTGALQTFPSALATGFVRHQVKAGVAINKGQAVYVSSADGTNMIVELASNASESTSSKTMGLLDATVSINGFANVVTEGLLAGLNTVGANAGDPVWLGTGGNLIYGLANKPYAPAHLVFIGIVTRVNANNGEIFVKVQNGFELDELHDVDLKSSSPTAGQLLRRDSDGLWKNWTPTYISSYAETDTLASVTARGASTSTGVAFNGGATATNLRLNGAPISSEASLSLGAHTVDEGGQLVLNKATGHNFAAHIDVWRDILRFLYGTDTATAGVAMSINLSTRQLVLNSYTSVSSFSGTAVGYLAFDSAGNVITVASPSGAVTSVNAGTGVSVNATTGAVTVSIGQSVATSATPSFDKVFLTNNGNGTNLKVGDDVWIGDVNNANTLGIVGQQDSTAGYITFGSELSAKLGRTGTGDLTWGGSKIWTAANLTNLNQLTNGPGYITGITSANVIAALGYTPYDSTNPNGYISSYTETDPTVPSHVKSITTTEKGNWNTAYSWGNHASVGYLTSVTNISGYSGTLLREDNRTIAPDELQSGQLKFGFTSWANNNSAPYADFLHMRSYTDASGGSDNLIMFLKSGIGMRIWQQTWGSSSPYASYVDVWTTGNFTQSTVNNWNTAYSWGNHASQGYATTSYVDTKVNNLINGAPGALDTLNELATALGNDPNFATTVTNSIAAKLPLAGGTMTGNINWAQTDLGLTWGMNTDGAYIKFFNTGDGDTDSRLEYATSDNGDEYHRWMISGSEEMTLKYDGLRVRDAIWISGNLVATQAWVLSQGYLTSLPSHNHDDRYFTESESDARYPLSRGAFGSSSNPGETTGWANNLAAGTYVRNYTGHSGQVIVSHDTGGSVGNIAIEVTYGGSMWVHTNVDSTSWATKTVWTSANFTQTNINNWSTAYGWGNHASAGYLTSLPSHNHDDRYYTESESDARYLYYRGINAEADFQRFQDGVGEVRFDQINDYNNLSNAPGGYNYGGVLSMRGDNFGFQIWGSHTGDLQYKTQWSGDNYTGWRSIITALNIGSQSVNYATTAGSANSVAWTNVSSRPTALSQFTNDLGNYGGWITGYTETDTLATVTARGASTGTAVTFSSTANHFQGHHYFDSYDSNGNHYPHYNPGSAANGSKLNLRMFDSAGNAIVFYLNGTSKEISWNGNAIWHAGNDGAGSGLDADLLDGFERSATGGANYIAQYASNGYLYVNNWIHPANGTGLFYDSGPHFYENSGEMYSSHALRVNGRLYLNDVESANVYGIRGRFTNEYIHLYNKVGIGNPSGWGQGEGNTPVYGLSTYGGINIAYGYDGGATINTYTRINKEWGGGDFGAEQFSIVGSYPSLTLRNTDNDSKWLIHHDGAGTLNYYYGQTWSDNSWASQFRFSRTGDLEINGSLNEQSSIKYKENIVSLDSVSEKVYQLRPVQYNKKGSDSTEIGLIAEEVAEIFPEFVNYNSNGEVESLNYTRLSVVLLQTVKELSDKINKLETK